MRILIAEDESVSRRLLEAALVKWGHAVTATANGLEAWQALQGDDAPPLVILDWLMPELDGIEVCRRARTLHHRQASHIILLTGKNSKEDIVRGLEAGADDYITKPFDHGELRARVKVGERLIQLQAALGDRVNELEAALARERELQGLLPICSYCKKIRDDQNYWHQVESYIVEHHTRVRFSHGVCPDCSTKLDAEVDKL
jgi:sigma-B regulation protein RsbU (phosphoserine phosphatase)